MANSSNNYLSVLADFFYPQRCVACSERASDLLCAGCFEALPLIEKPVCRRCALPTAFETPVCENCKGVDLGFDAARAPLRYEGVGQELVHALKYRGYMPVVPKLAAPLMLESLEGAGSFDAVIPVPLHRWRLARRGFNQAAVLAREVAGALDVRYSETLWATRRTRDQVELSAAERRENVSGAFRAEERVGGKVLLVDDVLTTGATLSACAEALREAGVGEIYVLTLCRAC